MLELQDPNGEKVDYFRQQALLFRGSWFLSYGISMFCFAGVELPELELLISEALAKVYEKATITFQISGLHP